MGVTSIVACCHSVGFVHVFRLSDNSSCICLNYKLVGHGQPFTKRQKSNMKLSLVVDHTNIVQKQVITRSYLVL